MSLTERILNHGGWEPMYDPVAGILGIEIFERNGRIICVPEMGGISEIQNVFERLRDLIASGRPRISDIVFAGGGTLKIPEWFRDFCDLMGIQMHIIGEGESFAGELG
jgi:hypothetical protein